MIPKLPPPLAAHSSDLCARLGVEPDWPNQDLKVGVSEAALRGELPLHGLRHSPAGDTSGWYLWSGDAMGLDDDFFQPLHAGHLFADKHPAASYLCLPPGWRFLIRQDHEDVWFDARLRDVE